MEEAAAPKGAVAHSLGTTGLYILYVNVTQLLH